MKFIKLRCHPRVLNNAEDKMIYINSDCIRSIQQVTYDSTWTVINYIGFDDKCICVLETPEEILELLK